MAVENWRGDEIAAQIHAEYTRRIAACAVVVLNYARQLLSLPGTASAIRKFSYWYGGEKRTVTKRGRVYGAVVSEPGEAPRKQTGHLRRSVASEQDGLIARVGTGVKYGRWLELGTRKMAARPWLRRALTDMQSRIQEILSAPLR